MPDENNGITRPGPVEVRIHRSEDPPVEVSFDPRIGLPFDEPIDVPLDQPIDQPAEISRESSERPLPPPRPSEPRSEQVPEPSVARSSELHVVPSVDRTVDRSYPRFGHAEAPPAVVASERPSNRWLGIVAALVIGALGGYAAGFMVGQRETRSRPGVESQTDVAPPAGESFTESTVPSKAPETAASPDAAAAPETIEAPEPRPVDAARVSETTARRDRNERPSPPVSAGNNGSLLVRSVPSGARVVVDGEARGVTPLALRSLSYGTHNVEVTYLGYEPRQRRVALTAERPAQSIDFELRASRAAAAGSAVSRSVPADTPAELRVDSRPRGARVLVDNRPVGVTPLVLPAVRAGSHAVRLEMEGYRSWSTSVYVEAGGRARVAASLEAQENR
jgi:hypothetical protein